MELPEVSVPMIEDSGHFRSMQEEFSGLSGNLRRTITRLGSTRGDLRNELSSKSANLVERLRFLLKEMDIELKTNPGLKSRFQVSVERMKNELEEHRRTLEDLEHDSSKSDSSRKGLLEAHQIHDEIADSTIGIQRDLVEAEEIGIGVNTRLVEQREQIIRVKDRVEDTDDALVRSRKILTRMGRRVLTDKCTQALVIVLELGIIACIVYLKWFKK